MPALQKIIKNQKKRLKQTSSRFLLAVAIITMTAGFDRPVSGQSPPAYPPHNQSIFAPLPLPPPNAIRASDGRPGPAYWQQQADYHIQATLDPSTHRIEGSVTITYTNNSPNPLDQLWLQLDQNAFAAGSRNAYLHGPNSRWRGAFEDGGFSLSGISLARQGNHETPEYSIDDTRLRIPLSPPLPPGGSVIDISMDFAFTAPEYGADRTGRMEVEQGTVYQVAQWYPRMFVYDDVNGWNAMPYLGQGEFYLEYGNYDVEITAPADFVVVGSGELMNPEEVYTSDQVDRLQRARTSDRTVEIIRPRDVGKRNSRPTDSDMITWQFRAENVRDVAWAASQAFIVDAAGWEGILLMSAYPKEGMGTDEDPGWERSTEYLLHTIPFYSNQWYQYPYPVAVNVAGPIGGMEYPMLVFCRLERRGQALFGVTDHEFGHTWFPMIVGSDERRHAWMDEGFNTFLNYYSNLAFYGEEAEHLQRYTPERTAGRMQEPIADQPVMTYPDRLRGEGVGFLAYRKPGVGLLLLREHILGPERFDAAFKAYIERWAYKHPQPADFFRTMEQVAGEDLSWFWRGWFYGTAPFDPSLVLAGDEPHVHLQQTSETLLPVDVELQYTDGTSERRRIPVEAFFKQDLAPIAPFSDTSIQRIVIDPDHQLPDADRSNNVWSR